MSDVGAVSPVNQWLREVRLTTEAECVCVLQGKSLAAQSTDIHLPPCKTLKGTQQNFFMKYTLYIMPVLHLLFFISALFYTQFNENYSYMSMYFLYNTHLYAFLSIPWTLNSL